MKSNLIHLEAAGLAACVMHTYAAGRHPNFIVIMVDDFRIGQFTPLSSGIMMF